MLATEKQHDAGIFWTLSVELRIKIQCIATLVDENTEIDRWKDVPHQRQRLVVCPIPL